MRIPHLDYGFDAIVMDSRAGGPRSGWPRSRRGRNARLSSRGIAYTSFGSYTKTIGSIFESLEMYAF